MKDWLPLIFVFVVAPIILGFELWWWFSAPCSFVKEYWYLGHTPGRCL